jgi:hypothetical protein
MLVVRRLVSTLTLASFALQACGGTTENTASQLVKTPELPVSDQEARCKVRKSQAEPLIVEWPNASRGRLESMSKRSLVAIKYSGCELEQLPACTVKPSVGNYAYWPITRKQSRVTMHNADELYANMPVGAVSLEGKLKTAGQLEVNMTIVGRYEAPTHTFYQDDLQGDCAGATHVIAALTTGSFTFSAGGDAEVGAGVAVGNAGAGGKSTAKKETLQSDGDESACARSTATDKAPPEGCGALLQIEVTSLQPGNRPPPPAPVVVAPVPVPVTPPVEPPPSEKPLPPKKPPKCKKGERVEDGVCVKIGKKPTKPPAIAALSVTCAAAQHKEGTKCVDDAPAPAPEPPKPAPITQCASGMRLEGDHCVSALEPEPEPTPAPVTPHETKHTPSSYDAPTHPTEYPNPLRTTLAYVALGMGITSLSAGLIALKAAGTVKDGCDPSHRTCSTDADDAKSTALIAAVVADASLGLGVAALITMFLVPSTTHVAISPTKNGATIGARWFW